MDEQGLPHQGLDLGIKPLDRTMQIAGPAYTVAAGPEMRPRNELPSNPKLDDFGVYNGKSRPRRFALAMTAGAYASSCGRLTRKTTVSIAYLRTQTRPSSRISAT